MKRLSQSGSSNFCPELRKNALLISQSYFSNFALHMINCNIHLHFTVFGLKITVSELYDMEGICINSNLEK